MTLTAKTHLLSWHDIVPLVLLLLRPWLSVFHSVLAWVRKNIRTSYLLSMPLVFIHITDVPPSSTISRIFSSRIFFFVFDQITWSLHHIDERVRDDCYFSNRWLLRRRRRHHPLSSQCDFVVILRRNLRWIVTLFIAFLTTYMDRQISYRVMNNQTHS